MVHLLIESKDKTLNPEEGRKAVGNIIFAMRKDLVGKTKLDYYDFQYTHVIENK